MVSESSRVDPGSSWQQAGAPHAGAGGGAGRGSAYTIPPVNPGSYKGNFMYGGGRWH